MVLLPYNSPLKLQGHGVWQNQSQIHKKNAPICIGWLLCIAIYINDFGAFPKNTFPYTGYTIGDSNRGQARATLKSTIPYTRNNLARFYSFCYIVFKKYYS